MSPEQEGVCLLLGAGGARGFAHLGVLKRLEEEHIRITSIIGCSVGGLVASFYAAGGYTPEEQIQFGKQIRAKALLKHVWLHWTRQTARAFETAPGKILKSLYPCSFHRLHHGIQRLGIVAYDLKRMEEILFTGYGEHANVTVREATVGTAAIPFLAPPKIIWREDLSYYLIDPGFRTTLPLGAAIQSPFDTQYVVAVDLSVRPYLRRRWLASKVRMERQLASRLIYLRPDVKRFGSIFFEEERIPEIVGAGTACVTEDVLRTLRRYQ